MGIFDRKVKCEKFFTYKTNTIDLSGLSVGIPSEKLVGLDIKLGQFRLDPKFVEASELLQKLDILQFSTCQDISSISNKEKRDELLAKHAEIKMQMLLVVLNPEKAGTIKLPEPIVTSILTNTVVSNCVDLKKMLSYNKNVGKVLNILQQKLPNENAVILFLSDYNQLSEEIQIGIKSFSGTEWKSLLYRIGQLIDMKCVD